MAHHHHDHAHDAHAGNKKTLRLSLAVIAGYMLVEAVGGYLTGSLALLSDAGHMFSDAAALALSLFAFHLSGKPAGLKSTFGYKRFEIIAASLNGLTLVVMAAWILIEAVIRLFHPPEVATAGMLAIAGIGLLVNIVVAAYMLRNGDTHGNLNMRGAYLHVLGDLFGSVGAVAAGILMLCFGWQWADPLAALLVAVLIGKSGVGILKPAVRILMESVPADIDLAELAGLMEKEPGVLSVHDLHAWTITGGFEALSCHVVVDGNLTVDEAGRIVTALMGMLNGQGIAHATIQTEGAGHGHAAGLLCSAGAAGQDCAGSISEHDVHNRSENG